MPTILLESEFLTVDLSKMYKPSGDNDAADELAATQDRGGDAGEGEAEVDTSKFTFGDWGKELERRKAANKAMSRESRLTDLALETKFFKEFYSAKWPDPTEAKQLMMIGEPLRRVLKALGFNPNKNPILKFLTMDHVRRTLLRTKLINAITFQALFEALRQKLVAQTAFMEINDYNILYCPDLYRRSKTEMVEYFKLQSQHLSPNPGAKYKKAEQDRNKQIFFQIKIPAVNVQGKKIIADTSNPSKHMAMLKRYVKDGGKLPSALDQNTKLNELSFATALAGNADRLAFSRDTDTPTKGHLSDDQIASLIKKLDSPARKLAALMQFSMKYNSASAKSAIAKGYFSDVPTADVVKATLEIEKLLPKAQLTSKNMDAVVAAIIGSTKK